MMRGALAVLGQMAIAVVVAVIVAAVSLVAIARVEWPAYNSSNQLHALTTVGQFGCLAGLFASGWLWRRGRRLAARAGALVFLPAFSVVTLGMPLGATKLYLFGISVDQQFRTEYLTRLTDTAALRDMTYFGLPPFYPAGWFWIGGRMAAATGTPAWEMFKPWAITSITIAIVVAFVLWASMIRFEYALIVSTATAAAALAYSPAEPYAAVITVLLPPVLVLAWSGLRGRTRGGGWAAVVGVGVFLGIAALSYTLLLAYGAFTVAIMAVALALARRSAEPLLRLGVIAVIAVAIALVGWLPYLLAAVGRIARRFGHGAALPAARRRAAVLPDARVHASRCAVHGRHAVAGGARPQLDAGGRAGVRRARRLRLVAVVDADHAGRHHAAVVPAAPTLTVLLTAAGAFGFLELTLAVARRYSPETGRRIVVAAGAVGALGAMTFAQDIPDVLRSDIVVAYTDTDGYGQRADRRPPGAEKYYREIDARIQEVTGRPRSETVVLTADYSFLSYYPYYGFQGLTSHYANPLAQFEKRAAAIEHWATLERADQFIDDLDKLPWEPPTVFLMRRGGAGDSGDNYTLRLASDVYPNQPNVRRYQVALDAALFDDPRFSVSDIGPFVLAIRKPEGG